MMNKKLILISTLTILLISQFSGIAFALEPCNPEKRYWNQCEGTKPTRNGSTFSGEWRNNKPNGQGKIKLTPVNGGTYEGGWKDGEYHGQGTRILKNGNKYVGEFKNGDKDGQGTYTFNDGTQYTGEFKDDGVNGQGTYTSVNGDQYVGEFKDGKFHGQGTLNYGPNSKWKGDQYVGEFKDDKFHGQGTYNFGPNSKWKGDQYVGEWKEDKVHGEGTYTYSDGSTKHGWWEDDVCKYACTVTSPIKTSSDSLSQPDNKQNSGWYKDLEGEKGLKCESAYRHTYYLINIDQEYIRDVVYEDLDEGTIHPNIQNKRINEPHSFWLEEIPIKSDAYVIKWEWMNPALEIMVGWKPTRHTLNRETLELEIKDMANSQSRESCSIVDKSIVQDLLKAGLDSLAEQLQKADKDAEEQLKKNQL